MRSRGSAVNEVTLPFKFTPRDYQIPPMAAWTLGLKGLLPYGTEELGKRKHLLMLLPRRCRNGGLYFYIFPTYAQAKKSIWDGKDREGFPFTGHFPDILVEKRKFAN